MNNLYAVIFAGGTGSRLWPISRRKNPKQLHPFLDNADTLLQRTWKRVRQILPPERIYLSTVQGYEDMVTLQLPEFVLNNLIVEPALRDTTAAIGLASAIISQRHPGSFMMNIWSDHVYTDEVGFANLVKRFYALAQTNPQVIMSMGVPIKYPYTGYGYLEVEPTPLQAPEQIYLVRRFVEKPSLSDAESYMRAGNFYWNPALWLWQTEHMLDLYRQYVPDIYQGLIKIKDTVDTANYLATLATIYPTFTKIAVDYAIFEKGPTMWLVPAELGWRDVGSWQSVYEVLNGKEEEKTVATKGKTLAIGCQDTLVFNEDEQKLVTVVGLEDIAVINTKDAILVVKKSRDQEVKQVIVNLEKAEMTEYL